MVVGLSQRQYNALRFWWAQDQAQFHNAHFTGDKIPWLPEDFLSKGRRAKRKHEAGMEALRVDKMNANLVDIRPGVPASKLKDIPKWALGKQYLIGEQGDA